MLLNYFPNIVGETDIANIFLQHDWTIWVRVAVIAFAVWIIFKIASSAVKVLALLFVLFLLYSLFM